MGNRNNREQWAGLERLRYIENTAYWKGTINRADLLETFGISSAQASGDFQSYHEVNPEALIYNLSKKRYEAARDMRLAYAPLPLEEAMRLFLGETAAVRPTTSPAASTQTSSAKVSLLQLPQRRADMEIERRAFLAVVDGKHLHIHYHSLHGSTARWRWIRPHAFGHDGQRWHLRAWCTENLAYRDFVLARIAQADWPTTPETVDSPLPPDKDWLEYSELRLKPSTKLTPEQRQGVLLEYNMQDGEMTIQCRRAMEPYLRNLLQLPASDGSATPSRLEEC